MNNQLAKQVALATVLVAVLVLGLSPLLPRSSARLDVFDSPIVTPPPNATPMPLPAETEKALEYIAKTEGISAGQLLIVNQHRREYLWLGKAFWAVTVLDVETRRWYSTMLDLSTGTFVDDVQAVEQADQDARRAEYGKLEPALLERMETMGAAEEVKVAVWVAGVRRRSDAELYAILAERYPQARTALEESGDPFMVGDYDLGMELENEYLKLQEEDVEQQLRPLVDYLEDQGYAVTTFSAMPSFVVALPKLAIADLAKRSDVGYIFLADQKEQPALDSVVPSDRVPVVWQKGIDGGGKRIGILEGGKVDFDSPWGDNYLHQGWVRPCNWGVSEHKTWVSSVAASFHSTYTGVAPQALVDDYCTNGEGGDTVAALATATTLSDPINVSAVFNATPSMIWVDAAFDHWSRAGLDTVVAAAGNVPQTGEYVGTPAKAWNVIGVGGSDHSRTAAWNDDAAWSSSSWRNPAYGDMEKPDVAAPAVNLVMIGPDRSLPTPQSGTSLAAPQVSGLVALLIDRNADLSNSPPAVRAIVMASAVHNVDGPRVIVPGQELCDGAGVIDAALADAIAQTKGSATSACNVPCWWNYTFNNANFPVSTSIERKFRASRGELVRVAISWFSVVDCPDEDHCFADYPYTNLDLSIWDPDNQAMPGAQSASSTNTFEVVEFTAPKTGEYTIDVHRSGSSTDQNDNRLGIAWVTDASYLPDLRNKDGFVSHLFIRNDGAQQRDVHVHYFNPSGGPANTNHPSDTCALNSSQQCWIDVSDFQRIPSGSLGSAIVDGGEDVSVVVRTLNSTQSLAYSSMPETSALGFQASSRLYLPNYMNGFYNWNSTIYIANAGTATTTAQVRYYNNAGSLTGSDNRLLQPNASVVVTPPTGSASVGGVRIVSSDASVPLAASVTHYNSNLGRQDAHAAVNVGAEDIYLPSVFRTYYGWESSINLFNTEAAAAGSCTITFYNPNGSDAGTLSCLPLNGYGSQTVALSGLPVNPGWAGSAHIHADNYLVAAVFQEHSTNNDWQAYRGFKSGASSLYVPWVQSSDDWTSSLTVMNVGCSSTTATVSFYGESGSWISDLAQSLNRYGSYVFYTGIPALARAAFITTNPSCPIVANLNAITGSVSDGGVSYSTVD